VRQGGQWTRSQALKNACILLLARAALAACDRLPARALVAMGRTAGRLAAIATAQAAFRSAEGTLGRAEAESVARACLPLIGENAALCLLLRRQGVRALDWVEVHDDDRIAFERVLARGRGAIFVSAHVGPFELLPAAVAELGLRPAIVVRESYDPRLDRLVDAHRHTRGIDVIHRGHPGAATRIVRALRAGQPVGFLPDLGGRVPSLEVPFLGDVRPFAIGPQHLAQRLGVPLVVGALRRRTHPRACQANDAHPGFRLTISEVETGGSLEVLTKRVARHLGAVIAEEATDFPWMALAPSAAQARIGP
jgi:KDO2-lipid IV(A) lauroyltransferase